MVAESAVLLAVKDFQKRGGRVSPHIVSELVDLVKKYQRIVASRQLHGIYYPAGHCSYVCLSVSADIGFVPNAAERHSLVFLSESGSN